MGVQFILGAGAKKNRGPIYFIFGVQTKLGVQLIVGPKKMRSIFFILVQKNGVQLFYFLGGGDKKNRVQFSGRSIYFCGPEKLGSNDLICGV